MRTSTGTGRPPPRRSTSRSCSTRSSLACSGGGSSEISSSSSVPLSACSMRPDAPLGGAGERAALVAEQLALQQLGRHRRAVDGDPRARSRAASSGGCSARRPPCRCRSRRAPAPWCCPSRRPRRRPAPRASPALSATRHRRGGGAPRVRRRAAVRTPAVRARFMAWSPCFFGAVSARATWARGPSRRARRRARARSPRRRRSIFSGGRAAATSSSLATRAASRFSSAIQRPVMLLADARARRTRSPGACARCRRRPGTARRRAADGRAASRADAGATADRMLPPNTGAPRWFARSAAASDSSGASGPWSHAGSAR